MSRTPSTSRPSKTSEKSTHPPTSRTPGSDAPTSGQKVRTKDPRNGQGDGIELGVPGWPARGPESLAGGVVRAIKPSRAEMIDRRHDVVSLLNAGATRETICRLLGEKYGVKGERIDRLVDEAMKARAEAFEKDRARYKSEQVQRLQSDLVRMRSQGKIPWGAVGRHEQLIARVTGTIEPIAVSVSGTIDVREALVAVVQRMGPDEIDRIVVEQMELTQAARALPPPVTNPTPMVIDMADPTKLPS